MMFASCHRRALPEYKAMPGLLWTVILRDVT